MILSYEDRMCRYMIRVGTATDRAKSSNSPATTYGARRVRTRTKCPTAETPERYALLVVIR